MLIDWNDQKSEKLERERGFSLESVSKLLLALHASSMKSDDPEQYQAIGLVEGRLITLIYEYRESHDGTDVIWLVTYWQSSSFERKLYEQEKI